MTELKNVDALMIDDKQPDPLSTLIADETTFQGLRIEYLTLDELEEYPTNPKDHDVQNIGGSISRFGFAVPFIIDERTNHLAAGHGRLKALTEMLMEGQSPPKYVRDRDGNWCVPVIRGVSFNSDAELKAFLIASNQLTTRGGWNDSLLAEIVADLAKIDPSATDYLGFDGDEIDRLIAAAETKTNEIDEIDLSDFDMPELPNIAYKVVISGLDLETAETLSEQLRDDWDHVEYEQYRE